MKSAHQALSPVPFSILGLLLAAGLAPAQQARPLEGERAREYRELPEGVAREPVTIWSDGTRMAGDLYLPTELEPDQKAPVIVFVNGTGGTKKRLPERMAPKFVAAGYAFLAFDFRGWGESESKLQMIEEMPVPDADGMVTVTARAVRWQMDFADQALDIHNAIAFVAGDQRVDHERIGILGTSYGGGLVVWTAATDPRVRCAAAQVPGMGGQRGEGYYHRAYVQQTQQARGEIEPVPYETGKPGGKMSSYEQMRYNPAKGLSYNPIAAAEDIDIPMLIIDAGQEELMDITKNGGRVAEILEERGTEVSYHIFEDIDHYGIYRERFDDAIGMEIEFFDQHLKAGE